MNLWIVVGGVVAVALLALVVVGTRRPRSAEEELSQPKPRLARIDTPGSLNPAGVRDLLQSIQAERKTGTLQLTAAGRTASLYFLFGHLFHAASDTLTGEPALLECLTWQDVHFTFDTTAQLPTAETIERPVDQIVA